MPARLALAAAVAVILTTDAGAQQRQSTVERGTQLHRPGTSNFDYAEADAGQCLARCVADRRCGYWVHTPERTCMLYEGAPSRFDRVGGQITSGQIIRR